MEHPVLFCRNLKLVPLCDTLANLNMAQLIKWSLLLHMGQLKLKKWFYNNWQQMDSNIGPFVTETTALPNGLFAHPLGRSARSTRHLDYPGLFFVYFRSFKTTYLLLEKMYALAGFKLESLDFKGEHADHLTTPPPKELLCCWNDVDLIGANSFFDKHFFHLGMKGFTAPSWQILETLYEWNLQP